eukprot:8360366-Karenia_brevis.AAC.1
MAMMKRIMKERLNRQHRRGIMDMDNPPEIKPGSANIESWPGEVMSPAPQATASLKRATAAKSKPKAMPRPRGRPKTRAPPVPRGTKGEGI